MPGKRRRFGYVRKLPPGRFQASFIGPPGARQTAPGTFRTKTDADRWLAAVEADILRGAWLNEDLGREPFGNYARRWLRDHPRIGPRYRETCERNLRPHLVPLYDVPLRALTPAVVREWYSSALRGSGGRISIQQAYRFLRAVMNTAVRDGAIVKNPCQIAGAGTDRAKERPVASPAEVAALVEAITPRYRAAVLLAAWCGLRRGEVLGLRRDDVDLVTGCVIVRRNRVELLSARTSFDAEPKTDAGKRTVALPRMSCRCWLSTWRAGLGPTECSSAAMAARCGATRCARRSIAHAVRSACLGSGSTTCATPARPWPRRPGRRRKI
jgi:hypothetical protein